MTQNKRIISVLGLNKSTIGMFTSYCHLLKSQLRDHWIINGVDKPSDIVIVSTDYTGLINSDTRVKIILGEPDVLAKTSNGQHGSTKIFNIPYPISSSKILYVLNKVSKIKSLQKKSKFYSKELFSLKNVFSKLISKAKHKVKTQRHKQKNNTPNLVANKLLNLRYPDTKRSLKIVFLGRPGSGKTTAITSAATNKTLTSEVSATDTVGLLKEQTTIGIDYGEYECDSGNKLRLYGTPGQIRYDYVQTQTVARADIYIILVDLSSVAPFAEFMYYKGIIHSAGNDGALWVVAFTHHDHKEHNMTRLSKEIRYKCHGEVLTLKVDTRQVDEVRFMLQKVAKIKLGEASLESHYAENNLFLKNINTPKFRYRSADYGTSN